MVNKKYINSLTVLLIALTGCDDNSSSSSAMGELSVASYNQQVSNIGDGTGDGLIASPVGAKLVYDDGFQGNSYDVGKVIVSKVVESCNRNCQAGDPMPNNPIDGFGYGISYVVPSNAASDAAILFYVDADNDPTTGQSIDDIGADYALVMTANISFNSSIFVQGDFMWSSGYWNSTASGSYGIFDDVSSIKSIVQLLPEQHLLGLTDAKGIIAIQRVANDDINTILETLDITPSFAFDTPL